MISRLGTLFLFVLLVSCTQKPAATFTISGKVSPITENYIILKQESDIERKISTLIDTILVNKEGEFNAQVYLEPHLYTLHFNDSANLTLAIDKAQDLVLEVSALDQKEFKTKVTGSKDSEQLLAYEDYRLESLERLVKSVRKEIKRLKKEDSPNQQLIDSLGVLEISNYEKHLSELNTYITTKMETSLGLYATSIRWKGQENFKLFERLTSTFEKAYPTLDIAKKLREKVNRLQQTAIGGKVAEIKMASPDGTILALSSIHKKYTLIDFWASWCGPCRRESEVLNRIYDEHKNQGFEIFGVSLDDDRDKWLKALEKDNRTWANVSSLERFKTPVAFDYAVTALPDNYLIDKEYKIIAKNVHGEELDTLIRELMMKNN